MSIFDEAEELVNGQRQQDYGVPGACLARIAKVWSGLLPVSRELTIDDVCNAMAGLKLARQAENGTHHDSDVDAAGYLRLKELAADYTPPESGGLPYSRSSASGSSPFADFIKAAGDALGVRKCDGCGKSVVLRSPHEDERAQYAADSEMRDTLPANEGWAEVNDPYGVPFYCTAGPNYRHRVTL